MRLQIYTTNQSDVNENKEASLQMLPPYVFFRLIFIINISQDDSEAGST